MSEPNHDSPVDPRTALRESQSAARDGDLDKVRQWVSRGAPLERAGLNLGPLFSWGSP